MLRPQNMDLMKPVYGLWLTQRMRQILRAVFVVLFAQVLVAGLVRWAKRRRYLLGQSW
jgi:hypothetical protein